MTSQIQSSREILTVALIHTRPHGVMVQRSGCQYLIAYSVTILGRWFILKADTNICLDTFPPTVLSVKANAFLKKKNSSDLFIVLKNTFINLEGCHVHNQIASGSTWAGLTD